MFRGPTSSGWEQGLCQDATEEQEEFVFDGIRRADEPATAGPFSKTFLNLLAKQRGDGEARLPPLCDRSTTTGKRSTDP